MDKIKFNTLGLAPAVEAQEVVIGEGKITVVPEIAYEQVFDLIQFCIDYTINDRPFLSVPLQRVIRDFGVLKFYTNLDFGFLNDAHDMVEIYSVYDIIRRNRVMEVVEPLLNADQIKFFDETLNGTLQSIMAYRNSAQGIIETLAADADYNSEKMSQAMEMLGDEDQLKKVQALLNFADKIK